MGATEVVLIVALMKGRTIMSKRYPEILHERIGVSIVDDIQLQDEELVLACKEALELLTKIANKFGVATQGSDCDTLKTRRRLTKAIKAASEHDAISNDADREMGIE